MNRSQAFLKSQDWLAQPVNFYYRGQQKEGTFIGGCCSVWFSILFFIFVFMQLVTWSFSPSFNEFLSERYIDRRNEKVVFNIDPKIFLPTIIVCNSFKETYFDNEFNCNDKRYWEIGFQQQTPEEGFKDVGSILCKDLINSWTDLSVEQREQIKSELLFPDL